MSTKLILVIASLVLAGPVLAAGGSSSGGSSSGGTSSGGGGGGGGGGHGGGGGSGGGGGHGGGGGGHGGGGGGHIGAGGGGYFGVGGGGARGAGFGLGGRVAAASTHSAMLASHDATRSTHLHAGSAGTDKHEAVERSTSKVVGLDHHHHHHLHEPRFLEPATPDIGPCSWLPDWYHAWENCDSPRKTPVGAARQRS